MMLQRLGAIYLALFAAFSLMWYATLTSAAPPAAPALEVEDAPPVSEAELVTPVAREPLRAVVLPAQPPASPDWTPIAEQIFNALALALVAWVVRLVGPALLRAGDWIGQRAAAEDLLRDEKMAGLSRMIAVQALDWSLGRLGYTRADLKDVRIRHTVFEFAAGFVHEQWPEIWKWVDQNKNGQIDWFESATAAGLPPVEHALKGAAPAA